MRINHDAHPDLARFAERQALRQLERIARRLRLAQRTDAPEELSNALSWLVLALALADVSTTT